MQQKWANHNTIKITLNLPLSEDFKKVKAAAKANSHTALTTSLIQSNLSADT